MSALVLVSVRPNGTKEVVAIEDGYRGSTGGWRTAGFVYGVHADREKNPAGSVAHSKTLPGSSQSVQIDAQAPAWWPALPSVTCPRRPHLHGIRKRHAPTTNVCGTAP